MLDRFGGTDVLMMNNASPATNITGPLADWRALLGVNLCVIRHRRSFSRLLPAREAGARHQRGLKQGITTPPGSPYNVSKAGVKAFTEALEHELRSRKDAKVAPHLLIQASSSPGTDLTRGRTDHDR